MCKGKVKCFIACAVYLCVMSTMTFYLILSLDKNFFFSWLEDDLQAPDTLMDQT